MNIEKILKNKKWLIILISVSLVSIVVGVLASLLIKSPNQVKLESSAPNPTLITEKVTKQKISNTIISRGDIAPTESYYLALGALLENSSADPKDSSDGGSGILTNVFKTVGDEVDNGSNIAEINGRPFVTLHGKTTLYRDIMPLNKGPDVEALQSSLKALGYYYGHINGEYNSLTWEAARRLYKHLGYDPLVTDDPTWKPKTPKKDDNNQDVTTQKPDQVPYVSKNELYMLPSLPGHISKIADKVGYGIPKVITQISPSALEIKVSIPSDKSSLVHIGDEVDLYIDENHPVKGRVHREDNSSDKGQDDSGINYIVTPDSPLDYKLSGQNIKVIFTTASTSDAVLSVPFGAISADALGNSYVILVGEGDALNKIPVKVGVHGDSLVEIIPNNPGDVKTGDKVLIGR